MNRWKRLISALAVKSLLHFMAIVWVSVIIVVGLFVRADIINAVGTRYWIAAVLPLIILLYTIWLSCVVMMLREARLFGLGSAACPQDPAE